MKKSLLVLSLISVSLLSSCAKADARAAWFATQKEIKEAYIIKTWDKCDYAHLDAKKYADYLKQNGASNDVIENVKKDGNVVALKFTFTIMNGNQYEGASVYTSKRLYVGVFGDSNNGTKYVEALSAYTLYSAETSYTSHGIVVKPAKK